MVAAVRRALAGPCGVESGAPVVLGVSGGADSLALLVALLAIRRRGRMAGLDGERGGEGSGDVAKPDDLTVVHVHHHLRGSDADDDAAFVEMVARRFGLPFRRIDIHPAGEPGNIEGAARELRYQALGSAARDVGASVVMVGHHADDQLETMLMRFARGSGVEGLVGLRWRRPLEPGVDLVRPLLGVRRAECESLCRAAGLEPRIDRTNGDLSRARAQLRHQILPALEAMHPGLASRASGLSESLAAAAEALQENIAARFNPESRSHWSRGELAAEAPALLAAVLQRRAVTLRPTVRDRLSQSTLLEAADCIRDGDRRPRSFDWPAGLRLRITARDVAIEIDGDHGNRHSSHINHE